jgi:radical SAM superfamily enzyme YgiQ (UPF0313 family)
MSELAIIALPRLDLTRPSIAPAILGSLANQVGVKYKLYDFALGLYQASKKDEWDEFELFWQIDLKYKMSDELNDTLNKIFDNFVEQVLQDKPKIIAISVFSHNSINATTLFLEKIRTLTDAKIVIGGQGIQSRIYSKDSYAEYVLKRGLIDYYCAGEAETTFKQVLMGETEGPGINNFAWKQLENLDDTPVPDYRQYDLDHYHHLESGKSLWVNGSRGCVRRCDFCDIGKIWKKFRFRSGESLAKELVSQIQKHKVKSFQFGDALINGSMKAFNDMNATLIKYINDGKIQRPLLGGHFIVRPPNQMLPEHYRIAKQAGLDLISIGMETGSDELRSRMNKKFTNEDTAYHLEQCEKNGIKNLFLMFSGHPTETLEDHEKTLEMLKKFKRFVVSDTISSISIQNAAILEDTPLSHWANENNVIFNKEYVKGDNRLWFNPNNPTLTLKERVRRQLELYETSIALGYSVNNMTNNLQYMKRLLISSKDKAWQY